MGRRHSANEHKGESAKRLQGKVSLPLRRDTSKRWFQFSHWILLSLQETFGILVILTTVKSGSWCAENGRREIQKDPGNLTLVPQH